MPEVSRAIAARPRTSAKMGKILVIGAAGLIGAEVVKALGAENCIRASRCSDEKVDISDPRSLEALFGRVGEVDGIICTGGAARFKPWDQLDRRGLDVLARQQAARPGQRRPLRREVRHARAARSRSRPALLRNIRRPAARSSPRSTPRSTPSSARPPWSLRSRSASTPFRRLGRRNAAADGPGSGGRHPRRRRREDRGPPAPRGRRRLSRRPRRDDVPVRDARDLNGLRHQHRRARAICPSFSRD